MNDYFFFFHCFVVLSFLFVSIYLGKEALITFISCCWLFANFFVTKEIVLFGWEVTASDVYTIGAMLGLSVIQEYWGRKTAKKTIWISFLVLFFIAASSYLHLCYTPSPYDVMHIHYEKILNSTPRLIAASFITFIIAQYLEIALFTLLQKYRKIPFFVRAYCTGSVVLMIDTLLFSFLGLYGIVHAPFDIFVISYCIKLIIMGLSVPFLAFSKYLLHQETYDKLSV